jgi:hypothetical protein
MPDGHQARCVPEKRFPCSHPIDLSVTRIIRSATFVDYNSLVSRALHSIILPEPHRSPGAQNLLSKRFGVVSLLGSHTIAHVTNRTNEWTRDW